MLRNKDPENYTNFIMAINFHANGLKEANFSTNYADLLQRFSSGGGARINCPDLYQAWKKFYSYCFNNKKKVYKNAENCWSWKMNDQFLDIMNDLTNLSVELANKIFFTAPNLDKNNEAHLNDHEKQKLLSIHQKMVAQNIMTNTGLISPKCASRILGV